MAGRLDGRHAFITGGESGIGLATAELFLAEGAQVSILGADKAKLEAAQERLGDTVRTYAGDVTGLPVDQAAAAFEETIPLRRHASVADIARTVLFLCSDDSAFMTGTTVVVDGGMSV